MFFVKPDYRASAKPIVVDIRLGTMQLSIFDFDPDTDLDPESFVRPFKNRGRPTR
jgi:hypothetical protein